jgi:hypothetical protein
MISEFVGETSARKIRNVHNTYSVVLFPQGALHLEFNPNCEPMTFVAAFNSEGNGEWIRSILISATITSLARVKNI